MPKGERKEKKSSLAVCDWRIWDFCPFAVDASCQHQPAPAYRPTARCQVPTANCQLLPTAANYIPTPTSTQPNLNSKNPRQRYHLQPQWPSSPAVSILSLSLSLSAAHALALAPALASAFPLPCAIDRVPGSLVSARHDSLVGQWLAACDAIPIPVSIPRAQHHNPESPLPPPPPSPHRPPPADCLCRISLLMPGHPLLLGL